MYVLQEEFFPFTVFMKKEMGICFSRVDEAVTDPTPRQNRTCPIKAYGSSYHRSIYLEQFSHQHWPIPVCANPNCLR